MEPLAPGGTGAASNRKTDVRQSPKAAGPAPASEPGGSFFARVVSDKGGGAWLVKPEGAPGRRAGSSVLASSPGPLLPRELVRVAAERGPDGKTAYRVLGAAERSAAEALRGLGLPPDPVSAALVSSFRALGLKIEPQRLRHLRRAVEEAVGNGVDGREAARIAAAADDKGFDIQARAIEAVAGSADPGSGGGRGGARDRSGRRRADRLDVPELKAAVAEFQSSGAAGAFLNGAGGRSGKRWLFFPLSFSRGGVDIDASLRFLLHFSSPNTPVRVEYCVLDVRAPSRAWSFEFSGSDGTETVAVRADPPLRAGDAALRASVAEALSPAGVAAFPGGPPPSGAEFPSVREEA